MEPPAFHLSLEARSRATDRKHVATIGFLGRIGQDELPDEVVESRAEVVKTVAGNGAQLSWALREMEHEVTHIPLCIFSEDDFAADRRELLVDCDQRLQVFIGPQELRGGAGQRTS